ncbi:hypothetical protein TU81_18830 [Pseudomonas lini]|nr:hypothetical protein TU81_18830 [Pseudomonas lini]KNH45369.1 hypothetical protein ACS73_15220 [Pseudomonas lini]
MLKHFAWLATFLPANIAFLKWRQHMAKNLNLMACTSLTRLPEETARVAVFLCLAIGLLPTCNIQ